MCADCLPSVPLTKAQCTPDNLVSELSHRPRVLVEGVIKVSSVPGFSSVRRDPSASPLGPWSKLSLELLQLVCNTLDFQSLSRLSRVSLGWKLAVESLTSYRAVMNHASHSLKALGQTLLIQYHSAVTLYAALTSQDCVSCGEYGPFLFLPTCERCCYECLLNNQSLWVIPENLAKICFHLTPQQLQETPIMRSIPGGYTIGHRISHRSPLRLVSVKAAKRAAINIHGTVDHLRKCDGLSTNPRVGEFNLIRRLRNAPLEPLSDNPSRLPEDPKFDNYCGMASITFPSVSSTGTLEMGLWCRGCELTLDRFGDSESDLVSTISGVDEYRVVMGRMRQARSKSEFLQHIIRCPGAKKIIPALQGNVEDD